MRWDRFFEDLEDQLDSEWEAERAALDTEAERLRVARLELRERLAAAVMDAGTRLACEISGGDTVAGIAVGSGPDWVALDDGSARGVVILPVHALISVSMMHADILRTARGSAPSRLRERMTLGFVLRDLVRRRIPVTVTVAGTRELSGTIDRAAADHLDLALHDHGTPRRSDLVTGHRLVPFASLTAIRLESPVDLV